ncbi:solute carrier family 38 (sodium-coupled neutral amino acid transporter), member 7/8 [Mytilus galloprovincialis]|uniref:Solute carrier family 38 (Sodium-coupled neutral amino acid transporter), member 7/8 n=1 Tax=Mytilus galloprovincialis TaxID=29158 RepID=A0A8B6EV69_MYTGA|nr:solute carrier family 38 (sodium-coupled neutral amino acid transporter), member 7/8 [Mytilus galloprovincialis]
MTSVQNNVRPIYDGRYSVNASIDEGELNSLLNTVYISDSGNRTVRGSSWYASVFLVVNAALGAGLLNFPDSYRQAGGVMIAVVIQAIFLVFVVFAILILAYCSDIKSTDTYQDVVLSVCGRNAQRLCAFVVMTYCFGTCITFLIIIGDQWEEFLLFIAKDFYCKEHPWYLDRISTICVTSFLFILPICFPKRIDFLKYPSMFGVVAILYVEILVFVKYFLPHPPPGPIKTKPDHFIDVFLVVPTICFAYQCHVSIIPIYSCMENRNLKEFSKTISCAMLLCIVTYTGTAVCGYLTFGEHITADILLSYDPDIWVIIAVILIAFKTYTTYPILLFCGRAALVSFWVDIRKMSLHEIEDSERNRRIIVTIVWFILTLLLAVFIPNIGVVIQILGAFAAVFIFIFPGMCMMSAVQNLVDDGIWTRRLKGLAAFACAFILIGAFIFGLTLTQSVIADKNGVKADKSKYTC